MVISVLNFCLLLFGDIEYKKAKRLLELKEGVLPFYLYRHLKSTYTFVLTCYRYDTKSYMSEYHKS